MFNSITWGQYLSAIIFLLIIYYAVIGFKFYKLEILGIIGIRKVEAVALSTASLSDLKQFVSSDNSDYSRFKPALEIDISPLVQSFKLEVKFFVQKNEHVDMTKEELINSLNMIASKYSALKDADCKIDLEQFLLTEINMQYPNALQPSDLIKLWN